MAEIKFITEENLNTFAKNLFIPQQNKELIKFTMKTNESKTISNINFITKVFEDEDEDEGYYGYYGMCSVVDEEVGEVVKDYCCSIKSDKNCLLLFYQKQYGNFIFIDCIANENKVISIDQNESNFTFFLVGEYLNK